MPSASKPLTEAALLKMPASAYMNSDQLAFFRARLEMLRDEMLEQCGRYGRHIERKRKFCRSQ